MSVLSEINHQINILDIYDFENRSFRPPFENMMEITVDRRSSEECARLVYEDIFNMSCTMAQPTMMEFDRNRSIWDMVINSIQIVLSNERPPLINYSNPLFRNSIEKFKDYENDPRLNEQEKRRLREMIERMRHGNYNPLEMEHMDTSPLLSRILHDLNRTYLNRSFSSKCIAEFRRPYTIVVFMQTLADNFDGPMPLETRDQFAGTLAHELFHCYHYVSLFHKKEWDCRTRMENIPIESLASYYEYICYKHGRQFEKAADLLASWKDHDMDTWPYAGAKHLLYEENPRRDDLSVSTCKFNSVFADSLFGMKYGYEDLVTFRKLEEAPIFLDLAKRGN